VKSTDESKRVCIIGSSGGSGATTIACNLAMELAHLSERRSALVDLNLEFGDVACAFDCSPTYTVADICSDHTNLDRTLLARALYEMPCNLSLLARPTKIEHARQVTPEGVHEMLEVLGTMFSFVVVDLPRTFSFLSAAAVENADRLLLVTQLGVPFIRNATRIYECLLQMGASEDAIEIVVNRCTANHGRITPDEVEEHFGRPVFAMIPNDYQQVQSAIDLGHPIVTDAPASETRLAIQKMARSIANIKPPEEEGGNGEATARSLLRRFLKSSNKLRSKTKSKSQSKPKPEPEPKPDS
jgi:pilus assembly protein CpaE